MSQKEENSFLFLMSTCSNDGGSAITGSFSCMILGTLLLFDRTAFEQKQDYVAALIKLGEEVLSRKEELDEIVNPDFRYIVYVGSGSLVDLTRETQLRVLELTAGKVATIFDSSVDFRHEPKSFINEKIIMFGFVNNIPYTRDYDSDILEEVRGGEIAAGVLAIAQPGKRNFSGLTIGYSAETALLPDGYLALADIMMVQAVASLTSIKAGDKPDIPSPTDTMNRAVKNVTIYDCK